MSSVHIKCSSTANKQSRKKKMQLDEGGCYLIIWIPTRPPFKIESSEFGDEKALSLNSAIQQQRSIGTCMRLVDSLPFLYALRIINGDIK